MCEIKDVAIRGGLHVLAEAVTGDMRVELVLAMLRARQLWGGETAVPGLRESLGLSEAGDESRTRVDEVERIAHGLLADLEAAEWQTDAVERVIEDNAAYLPEDTRRDELHSLLMFACTEIIPRLARTEREIDQILHALEGRFIEPARPVPPCAVW